MSYDERFWSKVDASGPCWEWTAGVGVGGYGRFALSRLNDKTRCVYAHRYSYELLVGEIPEGLVIDHLCRNRKCVNPDHLEPVTQQENVLRGNGVTATNAKKDRCPKNHPYAEGRRRCLECDRERDKLRRGTLKS